MNNFFVSFDRLNSIAYNCYSLVAFNFGNSSYLLYYSPEDSNKCKIFISKFNFDNSNGYVLLDIDISEKNILNNIGYNIVVSFPSSYTVGKDINILFNDFESKNNISFLKDIPVFGEQDICRNSFLARSNIVDIKNIKLFYDKCLAIKDFNVKKDTSYWSIPISNSVIENNSISDVNVLSNSGIPDLGNINSIINLPSDKNIDQNITNLTIDKKNEKFDPFDFQIVGDSSVDTSNFVNGTNSFVCSNDVHTMFKQSPNDRSGFNYDLTNQIASSSNNLNTVNNSNSKELKKNAGFASSGYIIIGSICLVLAAIIVAVSIILVKKL